MSLSFQVATDIFQEGIIVDKCLSLALEISSRKTVYHPEVVDLRSFVFGV
jgi:hypothetical protein